MESLKGKRVRDFRRFTVAQPLWASARHNARSGVLALILLAAIAQGSARAEDDDDKNSIWNLDKRLLDAFAKGLGLVRSRCNLLATGQWDLEARPD